MLEVVWNSERRPYKAPALWDQSAISKMSHSFAFCVFLASIPFFSVLKLVWQSHQPFSFVVWDIAKAQNSKY